MQLLTRQISRSGLFGLFLYLNFFGLVNQVNADESALAAAPAIIEAVTTPNESTFKEIQVSNTTSFPLPIKGQAAAFLPDNPSDSADVSKLDASHWVTLEPADFILQPRSSQIVKVTITPPIGAEPGGHYATIYFSPLIPSIAVSPESSKGLARIGILTFLIVPGDLHQKIEITDFQVPTFSTFGPVTINYSLSNTGNVHLLPNVSLIVTNLSGRVVTQQAIEPSAVLPGFTKNASIPWGRKIMLGRFTAVLRVTNPADTNQTISSQPLTFYVVPWPIILILILVLTLFYKLFIVNRKRIKLAWQVLRGSTDVKGE